ncbi:GNAT family N-acetyltransferase [Altererythrobacter salegens]|uniref:GNAT family N-acetyltransferase n=1 Tax=Croceibacterium salegens TaxID=1737568 RepID=A0A6I4SVW9_9SPHN|nr:GNAT family N-acetyltransferase [Croceibacterium salegens]MXO60264.1 GNAT family N-acetyltransferase [Croceibacterium salegens]
MFYRSERLFLRPAFPEDCRAVYNGICDAGIVSMLSRAPWPYRMADAEQFCVREVQASQPRFLITLPDTPGAPIVGCIGLHKEVEGFEMGYWIARDHWGHGYASEAGRAVTEIAHALGYRKLVAGHFIDNPASGRVLRKIGFRETGEVRPTECRARGGDLLLARRYTLDLETTGSEVGDDNAMKAA